MKKEQGHELLKRLGKTKLRPGGKRATDWIFNNIDFSKKIKILEVACNEGYNLRELAKKYDIECYGIDKKEEWINIGKEKIKNENLQDKITLQIADATNLPFEDSSFDIVINEAMLTMLDPNSKLKALKEYSRVLKKGGFFFNHDIRQTEKDLELIKELQQVINVPANPLTKEEWIELFNKANFTVIDSLSDRMTLLSREGLETDEGRDGALNILLNALVDFNRKQFLEMIDFFRKAKNNLYFLAMMSRNDKEEN